MLIKPDDFAGRPYAYLTNQAGHFLLGFCVVTFYVWAQVVVTGIYIPQGVAVAVCVAVYFGFIELTLQGWRGLDTLQDTYFFACGTAAWLTIDMSQVIHKLMAAELLLAISLAIGTAREIRRARYV